MIRLGYQIGSGKPVDVPADRHIAISGQTQRSGKTTTLEALVRRSGKRAVAFVTKRAESGFRDASVIPPYFRDSADWQFVSSILEAMLGERMKFQRSWIIDACRHAKGLRDVLKNVAEGLHGVRNPAYQTWLDTPAKKRRKKSPNEWARKPAQGLNASVLTELEAYLDIVIPQLDRLPYARELRLAEGLNVMDLAEYSTELQALVIRSVLQWVYLRETNTVVIVPEAWKFIPQGRRSPVLLAAEELVREGAAAGNLIWLDSQDMAAVNKAILRSVTVWVIGKQMELNELGRAADYLRAARVKEEEISSLGRGQFFVACDGSISKVYVQPFWIADAHAAAIARGEEPVESAEKIWREGKRNAKSVIDHPAATPRNVRNRNKAKLILSEEGLPKTHPNYDAFEAISMAFPETWPGYSLHPTEGWIGNNSGICGQCGNWYSSRACGPSHAMVWNERKNWLDRTAACADSWHVSPSTVGVCPSCGSSISEIRGRVSIAKVPSTGGGAAAEWCAERSRDDQATVKTRLHETEPSLRMFDGDMLLDEVTRQCESEEVMPVVTIGLDRDSQGPILKKSNGGIIRLDEDTAAYIRCLQDYARTAGPIPYDTPAVKSSSAAPKRDADFQSMSNGHFAEFIRRLRRHPEVIALLAQQPEIRLTIERPRVDWDAGSLAGRIALLVSEGFFKSPKAHVPILAECKRRQWVDQNSKGGAILYNQLNKLAEMGFLTVESDGYQSVPGMKIDVVRK